jgi:hypothetical protein
LLQHADETSRRHGIGGERSWHLRETHAFDGSAKHVGKSLAMKGPDTAISIARPLSLIDHEASARRWIVAI